VILDEPNASLDSDGEAALLNALQRLKAQKRTVMLITHKTNILSITDKILVLANGQVQAFGDRDEIFAKLLAPRVAAVASSAPAGGSSAHTLPPAASRPTDGTIHVLQVAGKGCQSPGPGPR
jgi:ABC-type protease/lipase transport system fused ATPase/permease subunit